jgi:hypothetical protein
MKKTLIAIALVALVALVAGPATAGGKGNGGGGKGGGKPSGASGTISLVLLESTDGLAHYNQLVTFDITATIAEPWVNLKCYQGGTLVAEGWNGYFERSITGRNFRLSSPSWLGGDAECTAWLTTPQKAQFASTSFHVYA